MKSGMWLAALALLISVGGVAQGQSKEALKNPAALKEKAPAPARMRCKIQFLIDEEEGPNQPPEPTRSARGCYGRDEVKR